MHKSSQATQHSRSPFEAAPRPSSGRYHQGNQPFPLHVSVDWGRERRWDAVPCGCFNLPHSSKDGTFAVQGGYRGSQVESLLSAGIILAKRWFSSFHFSLGDFKLQGLGLPACWLGNSQSLNPYSLNSPRLRCTVLPSMKLMNSLCQCFYRWITPESWFSLPTQQSTLFSVLHWTTKRDRGLPEECDLAWQPDRPMHCTQERLVPVKLCPVVGPSKPTGPGEAGLSLGW